MTEKSNRVLSIVATAVFCLIAVIAEYVLLLSVYLTCQRMEALPEGGYKLVFSFQAEAIPYLFCAILIAATAVLRVLCLLRPEKRKLLWVTLIAVALSLQSILIVMDNMTVWYILTVRWQYGGNIAILRILNGVKLGLLTLSTALELWHLFLTLKKECRPKAKRK